MKSANKRYALFKVLFWLLFSGVALLSAASCFLEGTDPGDSPLVGLANLLYLDGSWVWADSMVYSQYVPDDDVIMHHGSYVVSGTASLETLDSMEVETYVLAATAQIAHVDSTVNGEITRWRLTGIEYVDTVFVENDSIFGLSVEPIPPDADPTTDRIRWVFRSSQLWCTNWLTDTIRPGNGDHCATTVTWTRSDSTAS
jgi:hypothetical protein